MLKNEVFKLKNWNIENYWNPAKMDLWGAGINFILDGEKQKGQKNFEFLGKLKRKWGMLRSSSKRVFPDHWWSWSACAQIKYNVDDGYSLRWFSLAHQK